MHNLDETIEILTRTPGALQSLLQGLSQAWITGNYGDGTWSAGEVVGHLLIAEREDGMPRLRRILQHGESLSFDPFAHNATIPGGVAVPMQHLLDQFKALRATNLQELAALHLSPADLARTGMHPALGRVTAAQLLSTWAVHDLHHLRQICLAMAWQHREEVGPWRAYLNTLAR